MEAENKKLDAELCASELHEAVQSLKSGRAPGLDGLPADIYEAFWPQNVLIGEDFLLVLRASINKGRLPQSCLRAVLNLLPKSGDLLELKNWRPVSLLCADYKLLSKVLATRLRKVMERIIHVDQMCCVTQQVDA